MDGWNKQVQCSDERIFGKSGGRNVLHGGIFRKMLEMKAHSDSKCKKCLGKKKFVDRRQEKWQERQWTSLLEDNFQMNKRKRRNKRSSCDTGNSKPKESQRNYNWDNASMSKDI